MTRVGRIVAVCALGVIGAGLGACTHRNTSITALRLNPSPETHTLYERPADVQNTLAIMRNENWRMFYQDLGRALYTNRPSMLTPEPLPR
ncbi:MAG: hypothetical protein ACF8SC_00740 [Phycisphaerales bacterium JB037]